MFLDRFSLGKGKTEIDQMAQIDAELHDAFHRRADRNVEGFYLLLGQKIN